MILKIRMFGPFSVSEQHSLSEPTDSAPPTSNTGLLERLWGQKRSLELLAYLLRYHADRLTVSQITLDVWGNGMSESNVSKAAGDLNQLLWPADHPQIVVTNKKYRIDVSNIDVDIVSLDNAWQHRETDLESLRLATEKCEGRFLEGWDNEWALKAREYYEGRLCKALSLLARHELTLSNFDDVQDHLKKLRRFGDFSEELSLALMRGLLEADRSADADRFYREYSKTLRQTTERPPSLRMTNLWNTIQKVSAVFDPPIESIVVGDEASFTGPVDLTSEYYVVRSADSDFHTALVQRLGTVLVYGARQVGKSSLLCRGIAHCKQLGFRTCLSDFQALDSDSLVSLAAFYQTQMRTFYRNLSLSVKPEHYWDSNASPNENFGGYIEDIVLKQDAQPLVWFIDEADRVFDRDYRGNVFGLIRSWHNNRMLDQNNPFRKFCVVLAYSTEADLFIPHNHQSPFNIGIHVRLSDFTIEEARQLSIKYDALWQDSVEMEHLYAFVGGHPYLLRLCLYKMKMRHQGVRYIEAEADSDVGIFENHLANLYRGVTQDAELTNGVRFLLGRAHSSLSKMSFTRLRSAGIVSGTSTTDARFRCRLYELYFNRCIHD